MTVPSPVFKSIKGQTEAFASFDAAMKLWPIAFEHRDVPTKYGSTHVIVSGAKDAQPLVLLHCALMTSAIWSPVINVLSKSFTIYAVDVIGDFGRSVPSQPPCDDAEFAHWLELTLDGLGLSEVNLVGWSFGGFIAANFAIHFPQRVKRLALLAPFATFVRPGLGFFAGFLPMIFPTRWMVKWFERRLCYQRSFGVKEHSDILYQRFKNGRPVFKTGPRVFTDTELQRLAMPALLLVGEDEFLFDGPKAVERARNVMPAVQAELLSKCNHAVVSDQTAIVNAALRNFFRG